MPRCRNLAMKSKIRQLTVLREPSLSNVPEATSAALWLTTLAMRTIRLDDENPRGSIAELYRSTMGNTRTYSMAN